MKPPRDPFLRAIWQVSQTDLTPIQKLALLAVWRYLGGKAGPIGAALLRDLIGVSLGTAKNIFSALQRAGYLSSDGRFTPRHHKRATRGLTKKLRLPTKPGGKGRSSDSDRRRSLISDPKRSLISDIDQGVGHTGRPTPHRGDAPLEQKTLPAAVPISDTPENEVDAVSLAGVMASTPSAKGKMGES